MLVGRLAAFPAKWHYLVAPLEERDRFDAIIGELIAEELVRGLDATKEINELVAAARAQSCLVWLDQARQRLRQMIAADAFVGEHNEAEIIRAVEKTAVAADKTEAAYTRAAEAHDRATRDKDQAAALEHKFRDAQALLNTGDVIVLGAWQAVRQLRSEAV